MDLRLELEAIRGREVACRFERATGSIALTYGRHYRDEAEADFFGDHLAAGAPYGLRFEGISDYQSSLYETLHLGELESVALSGDQCRLRFTCAAFGLQQLAFRFTGAKILKAGESV